MNKHLEDRIKYLEALCKQSNQIIHNMVVANQAAYLEAMNGDKDAAVRWVTNGLVGPGHLVPADDPNFKSPQAFFDANVVEVDGMPERPKDEQPNRSQGAEWTSVEDRLPKSESEDQDIWCLVYDKHHGVSVHPFSERHNCWDDAEGDDYYCEAAGGRITHWMSLPAGPRVRG